MLYSVIWMFGIPAVAVWAIYRDMQVYGKVRRLYLVAWLIGTIAACSLPYALGHFPYRAILANLTIGVSAICMSAISNLISPIPGESLPPIIRAARESQAEFLSAEIDQEDEIAKARRSGWFGGRHASRESRACWTLLIFLPITLLIIWGLILGPAPSHSSSSQTPNINNSN